MVVGGGRWGSIKELKTGAILSVTPPPPPPPTHPTIFFILLCGVSSRLFHMGQWEKGGGGDCGMPWRLSVATTYSVLIQLLPCSFFRLCKFKICSMQYDCCTVISSL